MGKFIFKTSSILFSIILGVACLSNAAQPSWSKTDNKNGAPSDVAYDSFGYAYFISSAQPSPTSSMDIRIEKYSRNGHLLVTAYYDYHGLSDYPSKIKIDANNNIYIIGTGKSNVGPGQHDDALILKYNINLTLQWAANQNSVGNGNDYAVDFDIDKYNTIYVLCSFETPGLNSTKDIGIFAINTDGTNQHANYFSGDSVGTNQIAKRIMVGINGGTVYVCGANQSTTYGMDGLLYILTNYLSVYSRVDFHNTNTNSYDCFNDMAMDTNGNVVVWGESQTYLGPGNYLTRPLMVKYDFQLNYLWNNSLANTSSESAVKLFIDGTQSPIGITSAGRFVKFNTVNGTIAKNKPVVGKTVRIIDAEINDLGQVYMCGYEPHSNIYAGDSTSAYMAKRSNSGGFTWESNWMAPQFTTEESNLYVALTISGNKIFTIGAHNFNGAYELLMQGFKPSGLLRDVNDDALDSESEDNVAIEKTATDLITSDFKFDLYPNPAANFIDVKKNFNFDKGFITDVNGKVVVNFTSTDIQRIDITMLNKGIYSLTLVTGSNMVTKKFIKQ